MNLVVGCLRQGGCFKGVTGTKGADYVVLSLARADWWLVCEKFLHVGLQFCCVVLRFKAVVAGYLLLDCLAVGCNDWLTLIWLVITRTT